ncbi:MULTISPECIES: hypothetical protein [Ralstonia solanacearum species complex]|uniref:Transmembrane protein n=1 Tax=Ralstonia syzygii TaxID=28097 RepID=A0ABX7ZDB7_9RALS|nr:MULTISPECIES: hypothetical protein [Ralstonia solanacearum species complex]AMP37187.1 hypothetical protein LBM2029_06370 [Ralstonia solanacearum]AXV86004.1 hypothetical protein CJO78_06630 [Ralstonia solanacearum]QUP53396.1 hypothetical protein GO998_06270 [Ralstonia syzygii]
MKRVLLAIAVAIWLSGSTLWLTHLWLAHWEEFPQWPPTALIRWFVELYRATNGEETRDAEFWFGIAHFGILMSLFTWLCLTTWQRLLKRLRQRNLSQS